MRTITIVILLSAIAILVFDSCAREEVSELQTPIAREEVSEPQTPIEERPEERGERAEGVTFTSRVEGGLLKLRASAVSGLDQETVTMQNPQVERIFYEEDGEKSVELEAEKGLWNRESGQIEAEKEVRGVVRFEEEIIIRHAEWACYEPKKHTIIFEGRVRIERKKDILNADKVTIYLDEESKEILKVVAEGNVTGRIFPQEKEKPKDASYSR